MMSRADEIAWAAGLFEGEGCITLTYDVLTLRLTNTDEEVVTRMSAVMGFGTVYGPYRQDRNRDGLTRKPFWVWVAMDYDAYEALDVLSPWLSRRRLERAFELTGMRFPGKTPRHS